MIKINKTQAKIFLSRFVILGLINFHLYIFQQEYAEDKYWSR